MFASDRTKDCLRAQKCHKISGGGGGGEHPPDPQTVPLAFLGFLVMVAIIITSQCIVTLCAMGLLIVNAISFGSLLQATSCFVIEEG